MMPYTLNVKKKVKYPRCTKQKQKKYGLYLRLLLIKWWSETIWMTRQVKKKCGLK